MSSTSTLKQSNENKVKVIISGNKENSIKINN